MPSKVRILDPPHQQDRPLTSTNMVRGRSTLGPVVSGSDRPSTGGCAEYVPTLRKHDLGAGARASPSLEGCAHCAVRGLDRWSGRVRGYRCLLWLTGVNGTLMAHAGVGLPQDGGGEWVSRRVGELASERVGGQGSSWSTRRAERAGPLPPDPLRLRRRRDGIPTPLVTHHYPGPAVGPSWSEARRRRLYLVGSLGTL
jgi:hypothetical protein